MSDRHQKSYPVEVKATNDETGQVEAIVAVFGNVDHGGDRIVKGAFERTIRDWQKSGDPIPVVFNHEWGDLWSHIGVVDSIEETEKGLLTRYTLDVKDNPAAAQVYRLMKRRSLREHSFAYGIPKGGAAVTNDGVNELRDLDLFEVGPTLKGMNPDTELLSVKSAFERVTRQHAQQAETSKAAVVYEQKDAPAAAGEGDLWINPDTGECWVKAGRSLSKANERKLRTAMDSIAEVLSSLSEEEKSEKSSNEDETGTENGQEAGEVGGKSSDVELLSYQERIRLFQENQS
jgi:HK97 family phage prohead protease